MTKAHQYLTLFSASVYVRPAVIKFPFHRPRYRLSTCSFLLLVRLSGTHCPKTCRIPNVLRTVTDSHWRHFYLHSNSVFSTLEVCHENALYTRINTLLSDVDVNIDIKGSTVDVWVCVSKGFDKVNHFALYTTLMKRNIPAPLLDLTPPPKWPIGLLCRVGR